MKVKQNRTNRSSHPEVFLRKGVLKICSKFTGEHPRRSAISIKLLCNFIEITLRHGCSPVNLLHNFRTLFPKNISGRLLLNKVSRVNVIHITITIVMLRVTTLYSGFTTVFFEILNIEPQELTSWASTSATIATIQIIFKSDNNAQLKPTPNRSTE